MIVVRRVLAVVCFLFALPLAAFAIMALVGALTPGPFRALAIGVSILSTAAVVVTCLLGAFLWSRWEPSKQAVSDVFK